MFWPDVPIGDNCFVFEANVIQPGVRIGNDVVLWSGNHIGHDVEIGDHCFIASHVVVSGNVTIGNHCFLGVNATVRDGVTIAPRCVIGADALIMKDTEEGACLQRPGDTDRTSSRAGSSRTSELRWRRSDWSSEPPRPATWAASHAALPVVHRRRRWPSRLFFSPRDERGRTSHRRAAELSISEDGPAVCERPEPVLAPGPLGAFDDSGVDELVPRAATTSASSSYYTGWSLGVTVPFYFFVGCAVSDDGGALRAGLAALRCSAKRRSIRS